MYFLIGLLSNRARSVCIVNGNMWAIHPVWSKLLTSVDSLQKGKRFQEDCQSIIRLSVKISILLFCTERRVKLAVSQHMHSEVANGNVQC